MYVVVNDNELLSLYIKIQNIQYKYEMCIRLRALI